MKTKLHALFGIIALVCIGTFWLASLVSELFLGYESVLAVKKGILVAMWLLIPGMAATGASGFTLALGRSSRLIAAKSMRMKFIALNGLLVLLPSAFALHRMASAGRFDAMFYAVQVLELAAGAANMCLLALNIRDGVRLGGSLRKDRLRAADSLEN